MHISSALSGRGPWFGHLAFRGKECCERVSGLKRKELTGYGLKRNDVFKNILDLAAWTEEERSDMHGPWTEEERSDMSGPCTEKERSDMHGPWTEEERFM